jgi:hypothetical protein
VAGYLKEEHTEKIIHTYTDAEEWEKAKEKMEVSFLTKKIRIEYLQRDIHTKDAGRQKAIETGECKAEHVFRVQFPDTIR